MWTLNLANHLRYTSSFTFCIVYHLQRLAPWQRLCLATRHHFSGSTLQGISEVPGSLHQLIMPWPAAAAPGKTTAH